MAKYRIGFISTRLAGTDGVSLETAKWARVLGNSGHEILYMAGEWDTPADRSYLVHYCHFMNEAIWDIHGGGIGVTRRTRETTERGEYFKQQ